MRVSVWGEKQLQHELRLGPDGVVSFPLIGDVNLGGMTLDEARAIGRLADGLSQKEIEAEMELAPRGASRLLSGAYAKLGVRRRVQAAQEARDRLIA